MVNIYIGIAIGCFFNVLCLGIGYMIGIHTEEEQENIKSKNEIIDELRNNLANMKEEIV